MAANFSHKNQLFPLSPQSTQIKQSESPAQPAPVQFLNWSQGTMLCVEPARPDRAPKVSRCLGGCLQWEKGEPLGCFTWLQSVGNWNSQDLHQFHATGILKAPSSYSLASVEDQRKQILSRALPSTKGLRAGFSLAG